MVLFNIPKSERELKYGQLAYTKVPDILEKYEELHNKIVDNDPKYIKIGGECLEYLYTDEEVDVTLDISGLHYIIEEYEEIFSKLDNIIFRVDISRQFISIDFPRRRKKRIDEIVKMIQEKYRNVIESKQLNMESTEVYFSKKELITIAEICELLEVLADEIKELDKQISSICEKAEICIKLSPFRNCLSAEYSKIVDEQFKAERMLNVEWKLEGIFGTKEELRNVANF